MAGKAKPMKERFLSRVVIRGDACWLWTGAVFQTTLYGAFRMPFATHGGKLETAHRASWIIHRGEIPAGKYVLHTCDNRICVNPDHLYLGDHAQNMRDAVDRKRMHYGMADGMAKFPKAIIDEVRSAPGSLRKVAAEYGMSNQYVHEIKKGKKRLYA